MIIVQGEVYLEESHVALLRAEEEYVRKRYHAVARTLADDLVRIPRKQAAGLIGRSKRQLQRIVKRFREEGIAGLRFKSESSPLNSKEQDARTRREESGRGEERHRIWFRTACCDSQREPEGRVHEDHGHDVLQHSREEWSRGSRKKASEGVQDHSSGVVPTS